MTFSHFLKPLIFAIAIFMVCIPAMSAPSKDDSVSWMEAPSLKEAYAGKLEHLGMSVQYIAWKTGKHELASEAIQKGLGRHFTCITMGNEFKPDSILGTYTVGEPKAFETFTDSYGIEIDVPKNHLQFDVVDKCLQACKDNNLIMRGHVLVWHSQTPQWFFKEGFNSSADLVDKETMRARQEWYIKSVMEHIAEWEAKHNEGKRIIYCWDVVNEAVGDNANLRDVDSNWHKAYAPKKYEDGYEYIIDAFRYANKYAPNDVLLAYNDYNETVDGKRAEIIEVLNQVMAHEDDDVLPTRIDVMGMQSHIKYGDPLLETYEESIKMYLETGLDVHITELDIGAKTKKDANDDEKLKQTYKECYEMFLRYPKTETKNGISSVTIWGLTDDETWLNDDSQQPYLNNVKPQRPLLFDSNHRAKPAFYGVLEAAQ